MIQVQAGAPRRHPGVARHRSAFARDPRRAGAVQHADHARRRQCRRRLPRLVHGRGREPLQPRGDGGQGGAAGAHRARGRGRLSRQVLEHRRRRTAARRRHGRSLRRRPRGLARLVAGPGDDPGRLACRGRDGCVAGGAAGTPQGGRGGRHADAQFRHLLRHDGAARRPLEGSAQRLSGLARHSHGSGVPGAGARHPAASRRAARGSRRDRGSGC